MRTRLPPTYQNLACGWVGRPALGGGMKLAIMNEVHGSKC